MTTYELLDGSIQMGTGDYGNPPGHTGQKVGVAYWFLIQGKWYHWGGRGSQLVELLKDCAVLTLREFLEYCGEDLSMWRGDRP